MLKKNMFVCNINIRFFHIGTHHRPFNFGLAILFYSIYSLSSSLVNADQKASSNKNTDLDPYFQYFQGVDGKPGTDYPVYSYIPKTSFSCKNLESGYYADLETQCQVFHICEDNKKISFLCPNGTIFQQAELICEWWNKVNCTDSPNLYEESAERLVNEVARRKSYRKSHVTGNDKTTAKNPLETTQSRNKNTRIPSNYDIEKNIDKTDSVTRRSLTVNERAHNFGIKENAVLQNNQKYESSSSNHIVSSNSRSSGSQRSNPSEKETSVLFANTKNRNYKSSSASDESNYVRFSASPINLSKNTISGTIQSENPQLTLTTSSRDYNTEISKSLFQTTNNGFASTTEKNTRTRSNRDEKINKIPSQNQINHNEESKYNPEIVEENNAQNKIIQSVSNKSQISSDNLQYSTTSNPVGIQKEDEFLSKFNALNHKPDIRESSSQISTNSVSDETQVPEESASFVKTPYNSITDSSTKGSTSYSNHRSTYSEIKNPDSYSDSPKVFSATSALSSSSISSITPHLVTTQPINNGKPFIGSRVGTTLIPNQITTQSKYTYLPTGRAKTDYRLSDGSLAAPSTFRPLNIPIPRVGSLNLGVDDLLIPPVNEPVFVKKNVSLLYDKNNDEIPESSPPSTVTNSYYSPTVSTVMAKEQTINGPNAVTVKFKDGVDKISIQLSKNVFGASKNSDNNAVHVNTRLRIVDNNQLDTTTELSTLVTKRGNNNKNNNGFYVTKAATSFGTKIERPRPFSQSINSLNQFNLGDYKLPTYASPTFPPYQVSSAKPFELSSTTNSAPTKPTPQISLEDSMLQLLEEISNYNKNKYDLSNDSHPPLDVPPSVGPQALHTLVQYFANEYPNSNDDNNKNNENAEEVESKEEKITSLLTAMTIHGYNHLFNATGKTGIDKSTSDDDSTIASNSVPESRIKSETENTLDEEKESRTTDNELITATSTPELRHLAKNFSVALSSYLHDPDNFRNHLKNLRPTEPPQINDFNEKNNNASEEILKFSDQDVKPTTSAPPPPPASPTWGFILAAGNTDLHTANSQSFVPRYNNIATKEKNHFEKDLALNPAIINHNLKTTTPYFEIAVEDSKKDDNDEINVTKENIPPQLESEIKYELRQLPSINLNSTQVHGILIDFMNHTNNRLNRILKKLNTSEEDFLNKMKEIESNPLTKRLILLLITECGAKLTNDDNDNNSSSFLYNNNNNNNNNSKSDLQTFIHPKLSEDDQDARALQLLNSLYTIASKFGKK